MIPQFELAQPRIAAYPNSHLLAAHPQLGPAVKQELRSLAETLDKTASGGGAQGAGASAQIGADTPLARGEWILIPNGSWLPTAAGAGAPQLYARMNWDTGRMEVWPPTVYSGAGLPTLHKGQGPRCPADQPAKRPQGNGGP